MHILHCFLNKNYGPLEHIFLQHSKALSLLGHKVTAVVHPRFSGICELEDLKIPHYLVGSFFHTDPIAIYRLKSLMQSLNPDIVTAYGNRAARFLSTASTASRPLISAVYGSAIDYAIGTDRVLATSQSQKEKLIEAGQQEASISVIPEVVCPLPKASFSWDDPPVIGVTTPLEKGNGIDIFLSALRKMKQKNILFKAHIGGDGSLYKELKRTTDELGLKAHITFTGAITNRAQFFDGIHLFCQPSLGEFPSYNLLEAMAYKKPVVTTALDSVKGIVNHGNNGLLVAPGDANVLAYHLSSLINSQDSASFLAENGYHTICESHTLEVAASKLQTTIESLNYVYEAA
jgi:glycosyltransferase involved in cell wall biosynthesis